MAVKYRVGVIGLVHDHIWNLIKGFQVLSNVEVVAAADVNPPLLKKISKEHGVKKTYTSYRQLLDNEEIDIVLTGVENSRGAEIVEAAAKRGIHVMLEKPMAATLAQADRMVAAAKKARIKLMVNWPTAWDPAIQHSYRLVKDGLIGKAFQVRYRASHAGPKEIGCSRYFYEWLYDAKRNGAGALMDYCCYGADLCRWILGRPNSVVGVAGRLVKNYITVDDNAVLLLKYDHAIGINEACWTQIGEDPFYGLVINGTKGTIRVQRDHTLLITEGRNKKRAVRPPKPAKGMRSGPEYFVHCIDRGKKVEGMVSPEVSRDAQEILEAGLTSSKRGRAVKLPLK